MVRIKVITNIYFFLIIIEYKMNENKYKKAQTIINYLNPLQRVG